MKKKESSPSTSYKVKTEKHAEDLAIGYVSSVSPLYGLIVPHKVSPDDSRFIVILRIPKLGPTRGARVIVNRVNAEIEKYEDVDDVNRY